MTTLPQKPWLRPDEVALFFDVHVNTIRRWIDDGRLEASKIGNTRWRIPRLAVLRLTRTKKHS
jgi:excisionase family DNA binding protein